MPHLVFMEVHAVPVMSECGILTLPVLKKSDGPEGHEHAEEDRSRMVKQVAHLKTGKHENV